MTFLALWDRFSKVFRPAILEWLYNPPPMLGKMDPLEKVIADPASGVDPLWQEMSQMQVLDELFESTEVKTAALPHLISLFGIPPDMPGFGLYGILATMAWPLVRFVVGGSHSIAHAAISIIAENGGKLFTNSKVKKVLIENGKARGIRLADGSEVQARKVIVSNLNPQQLCFQLIGKEHLSSHILNRVSHLQSKITAITWYGWALHEAPKYKAARFNSDINEAGWLALGGRDYDKLARDCGLLRAGRMPEDPPVTVWCHSLVDKTRAPEGKHIAGHACLSLPATALGEKEWIKFNKEHAAYVIKTWQEYAPNMSWDNVIGYDAITPYDVAKRLSNLDPEGNWAVIDSIKSQFGRNRPIPELARYRTPIANLYATGAAWPPAGMAFSSQGYCCYKVIAEDFELRKPWQEKGRPY